MLQPAGNDQNRALLDLVVPYGQVILSAGIADALQAV